ncbi:MAG: septal ring lytic transglycosylase RlpA family protein [Thiothrix sp.]|uniref:septal ring lytic transglycosylase RlpA family protein n=1 Tax=Thiothrix sp. TaxID=1032 RepID=UPI00261CC94E|nr:septal ring lytic transglycosylase RlpA family protein [Thiothrix sp.]MDD5391713.1 septal ring lytic transglycosylase RlpA family protein [Thiothrix sp.]
MNPIKRLGLGILLGLSICASNFPTDAVAKGKVTEKTQTSKKTKHTVKKSEDKKAEKSSSKGKVKLASKSSKHKTDKADAADKPSSKGKAKLASKSAKHKADKAEEDNKTAKKDKTSRHAKLAKKYKKSSKVAEVKATHKTKTSRKSTATKHKLVRTPPTNQYNITFVPEGTAEEADTQAQGRLLQVGTASYYGDAFDGGRTASGERFDQDKLTCAHGSLPFGCKIRVTNLRNNKSVQVKVNDRGGFAKHGRVLDLSKAAAREIGMVNTGTAKVKIEVLE